MKGCVMRTFMVVIFVLSSLWGQFVPVSRDSHVVMINCLLPWNWSKPECYPTPAPSLEFAPTYTTLPRATTTPAPTQTPTEDVWVRFPVGSVVLYEYDEVTLQEIASGRSLKFRWSMGKDPLGAAMLQFEYMEQTNKTWRRFGYFQKNFWEADFWKEAIGFDYIVTSEYRLEITGQNQVTLTWTSKWRQYQP